MRTQLRSTAFHFRHLEKLLVAGACLLLSVGCGPTEAKPDPSTQAVVSGSVLKGGKPIAVDSNVTFFCEASGAQAGGKIDALGKFSLTGAESKTGIPAGRYKVMIRPPVKAVTMAPSSPEYQQMMMSGATQKDGPKANTSEIPIDFQSLESTKLILEVKSGTNTFDIDLDKLNY
ncbi:MAG: carboxypeptidase regulatory-like domain-containing protein [Planctomycetes bacterium]|nr:carboxypeptidase regulatory-like domain-containing protein [Planctomycetota bacterium]